MSFPASERDKQSQVRFFYLLDLNDLDSALKMVKQGHDINMYDRNGKTALHLLVQRRGDTKTIERFLDAGADPNKPDLDGKTPLMMEFDKNNYYFSIDRVQSLIKGGAGTAFKNGRMDAAVSALISNPHVSLSHKGEIIDLMVRCGAAVDEFKTDGVPLLSWSIKNKADQLTDYLVQKPQALVQVRDETGETPLLYAIKEKTGSAIINRLIEAGSDVNHTARDGTTPLKLAVGQNDAGLICKLLDRGATPVNVEEGGKTTPLLIWACQKDHTAVAGKLLEKGASLDVVDDAGVPASYYWDAAQRRARMAQGLAPLKEKVVWQKSDDDRIMRSEMEPTLGRELRDIFNFARRERLSVLVDPKSQHIDGMVLQGFDQMQDKELIREALEQFQRQGGKADVEIILRRVDNRKIKPLPGNS